MMTGASSKRRRSPPQKLAWAPEPDVRIARIRLSDKSSRLHPRHVVPKPAQAYEPEMPVEVREWVGPALASPGPFGRRREWPQALFCSAQDGDCRAIVARRHPSTVISDASRKAADWRRIHQSAIGAALDQWIGRQTDMASCPEAIRRLNVYGPTSTAKRSSK
jgi:hypothetical protein